MNKDAYGATGPGLFMGFVADGGNYPFKLDMGNSTNYLRWTGTGLEIKGTIAQGTTIQDSITKIVSVTGGNRSITYDSNGANPAPSTLGTFTANVYSNGSLITTGVSYS